VLSTEAEAEVDNTNRGLIILDIMRKKNPRIVLLYIQEQTAKNNTCSGIDIKHLMQK
jgi:hypothetical protein